MQQIKAWGPAILSYITGGGMLTLSANLFLEAVGGVAVIAGAYLTYWQARKTKAETRKIELENERSN